jgi:cytochrome c oxidase assembly factor CtaG
MSFCGGMLLLSVALMSPLDARADRLFSAHMLQHLILMMLAPPLLIIGHPIAVSLWSLPRDARRGVAAWWSRSAVIRPTIDFVRAPLPAWLLMSAVLWFWHLPKAYAAGLDDAVTHGFEHLTFFLGAILFWRVVIEDAQSRRLALGAAILFVATFAMQNGMLGALLIFAPRVLYAAYAVAPSWSTRTPLEDQQLAGVLMWSVSAVVDLGVLGYLFVAWLGSSDRRVILR